MHGASPVPSSHDKEVKDEAPNELTARIVDHR